MSVDQTSSRVTARTPERTKLVRYHDYIDEKIESTRRLVKVVDLATALVGLAVVLLCFLAVVIVAEHWLVRGGLSSGARWVLFAVVVLYLARFAYRQLWPLVSRAINPVYAAQTIEHGTPTLKNSLINLLIFRQRRADISDAVYRTLEEQAAQGLTRVQVDASVDQSNLIRLGYALIAIVALGALYKVFSPKDPFVTAERVLLPWAHVVPASRVLIGDIKPGSTTVSVGEAVDVSADVRGLRDDESVVLRYTTNDGQTVNRAVPMKAGKDGSKFTCRLTDGGDVSSGGGVTRSLTYWLEAGDARSLNYGITTVSAASILVERVDYQYPKYTGLVDRSVEGIGDIRAIEGTRVTVHARANGVIREANVDFDADGRRDLQMTSTESKAETSFQLQLRDDRTTPRHASYVLRFTNDEGRANIDPVKHAINIEPDLSPEVEIRFPQEKIRDIRADENVVIEVDASDPDYKLAAVRLKGQVSGSDVISESLSSGEQRRYTGRFTFVAAKRGLKAGDLLEYWVEADDNRAPKPNTTASERKSLRIVLPNPAQQPPPDRIARNDRPQLQQDAGAEQQQQNGQQQPGQNQQGGGKQGQNADKSQDNAAGGEGQQNKDNSDQQNQGQNDTSGQSPDGKQKDQSQQGGQGQKQDSAGERNGNQQSGDKGKGQELSKQGQSGNNKQYQTKSNDKQTGAGTAGGESSKDGAPSAGTRPDAAERGKEKETGRGGDRETGRQGEQKSDNASGAEKSPVSSEGDNDAEAFNRIQKHLEEKGELKKEGGEKEQQQDRQGDKERGRQGKQKGEQQNGSKSGEQSQQQSGSKSDNAGEKADKQQPGEGVKDKQETNGQQPQEKSPGGQETTSKGSPGGGNEEKPQGSPNSEQQRKPTDKPEQAPSKGEKSNKQEPPAGASSKRESDSHGDEGGDKSGGGEEGSGQKAQRDGTGSAGQNQSADEGAGQSGEKGKGENSSDGGQDAKSNEKTGSTDGKTQGKGSQQRDGAGEKADQTGRGGDNGKGRQGEKPEAVNGETTEKADQHASDQQKREDLKAQGGDKQNGGNASRDGQPGQAAPTSPTITGEAGPGDEANLEYARKQTDLVVNKLADQLSRKKVDEGLLKDLGWSEADLKKFVQRWQQRKLAADRGDESGEAAKRELDEALRSLGLRRGELQQTAAQKDAMRDLREGYRGPVPAEYKDRLKAYNQGVSRARREGE